MSGGSRGRGAAAAAPTALVLGRGRVGRGLGRALRAAGWRVRLAPGRRPPPSTDAGTVILAVPDRAIGEVAGSLRGRLGPSAVLLHVAGSVPASALDPAGLPEGRVGAMHPLVSFADPARPPSLAGTTFVCSGGRRATAAARRIARAAGARAVTHTSQGPAYHAAAALAANGSAALATLSVEVLSRLGWADRPARRAVAGLLRTVAENVERVGVPDALTGPVRRGDADTVAGHREALGALHRGARDAYDALVPSLLGVARRAGLGAAAARRVSRVTLRRPPR